MKWAAASSGALTLITQSTFNDLNVSVSGCFTNTYENYLILINAVNDSASSRQSFFQFINTGGSLISSDYYAATFGYNISSSLTNTNTNNASQVNWPTTPGSNAESETYYAINVFRPSGGSNPNFTGTIFEAADSSMKSFVTAGFLYNAAAIGGFKFSASTYNMQGSYKVYGFAKS